MAYKVLTNCPVCSETLKLQSYSAAIVTRRLKMSLNYLSWHLYRVISFIL